MSCIDLVLKLHSVYGREAEQGALFGAILSGLQIKNENGAQVKEQQKRWLQSCPSAGEDCATINAGLQRAFPDIQKY